MILATIFRQKFPKIAIVPLLLRALSGITTDRCMPPPPWSNHSYEVCQVSYSCMDLLSVILSNLKEFFSEL